MTELGTDISWWQGIVNFVKMKLAGAMFVIIRAGSCNSVTGACYWDYCVATNAKGAQDANLRKGFYWYYREFGIEHAKKQARFFWDAIKEWTIEEGLFIDVETWDANINNVYAFLVELQRVSGLPDDKIGIYSRAMLWNFVSHGPSWAKKFLCWVARYHSGIDHPWNDYPSTMRMRPWDEPDYWQFSADGNGKGKEFGVESRAIDLNLKFIVDEDEPDEPPTNDAIRVEIHIIPEEANVEVVEV